jgi:hypothetical protein
LDIEDKKRKRCSLGDEVNVFINSKGVCRAPTRCSVVLKALGAAYYRLQQKVEHALNGSAWFPGLISGPPS